MQTFRHFLKHKYSSTVQNLDTKLLNAQKSTFYLKYRPRVLPLAQLFYINRNIITITINILDVANINFFVDMHLKNKN